MPALVSPIVQPSLVDQVGIAALTDDTYLNRPDVNTGLHSAFNTLSPINDGSISMEPIIGIARANFSRADGTTDIAHVRDFENLYKKVPQNELRFQGARRVRNLITLSEEIESWAITNNATCTTGVEAPDGSNTAYTITITGAGGWWATADLLTAQDAGKVVRKSIWIRRRTGTGAVSLYDGGDTASLQAVTNSLTTEWQRLTVDSVTITGSGNNIAGVYISTNGDAVDIWHPMLEEVTGQTNQAPSEYVSRDVPFFENLIGNPNFDDDSVWIQASTDWTISGGVATFVGPVANPLYQTTYPNFGQGKKYRVTYTISGSSELAGLAPVVAGQLGAYNTTNGTHTQYVTAPVGGGFTQSFNLYPQSNLFDGSVDNVIVQEVTPGLKNFYTHNQNEVAENRLTNSNDIISNFSSQILPDAYFYNLGDWVVTGEDGTHIVTWISGGGIRYQSDTTTPVLSVADAGALTSGVYYKIVIKVRNWVSGYMKTDSFTASLNFGDTGDGTYVLYGKASTTTLTLYRATTDVDMEIESCEVFPCTTLGGWTINNNPEILDTEDGYHYISDISSTVLSYVQAGITVTDDSETHAVSWEICKKTETDPGTSYPELSAGFTGGSAVTTYCQFNPYSGALYNNSGVGSWFVEDKDTYWKVTCTVSNNGTGNTAFTHYTFPARYSSWLGGRTDAATGNIKVRNWCAHLSNTKTSEEYIETGDTAITNIVQTKTTSYEQSSNSFKYARELTNTGQWIQSNSLVFGDNVDGYDGTADAAYTLLDYRSDITSFLQGNVTIANDSNWHCISYKIKKDSVTTRFPEFGLHFFNGTTQYIYIQINTSTGASIARVTVGTSYHIVQDKGTWWNVIIGLKNNSTGNTLAACQIFAARGLNLGILAVSAVGELVVDQAQFHMNRVYPYSQFVDTDSYAVTMGKEIGLRDYYLHPIKNIRYRSRPKVFQRFNKWITATAYSVGDRIIPATGAGPSGGNGYYYECVKAGTTGGSEPTFGTTIGDGTYDNGVVWQCMGYYRVAGYLTEPTRTNSLTYSYDLTTWTQVGTAVSALDETGIDGVANHATTITDDDGASAERVYQDVTISNDSNTHVSHVFIKKDADTSRFPEIGVQLLNGTSQYNFIHLNTATGAITTANSLGTVSDWVEDHGDWWKVVIIVANNTTGNTLLQFSVYGARATVFGTRSDAATGSCIVGHAQVELNTISAVPSSPILTTGAADTRAADTLQYDNANIIDVPFSVLVSYAVLSSDYSDSVTSSILYTGSGSERPIYNQFGRALTYDGSVNASSSPHTGSWTKETPNMVIMGSRFSASATQSFVHGAGGTVLGASSFTQGAGLRIANTQVVSSVISDLLIYRKDLGSTKLAELTAYD